jgi:hypothetical protein
MAGFLDKRRMDMTPTSGWSVSKTLRKIASLGMNWDEQVIKQSKTTGVTEQELGNQGYMPTDFLYSLALSDIGHKKYIAYFDKADYIQKREYLRKFSLNGEIEFIIETIADETIILDDRNVFCVPETTYLKRVLKDDVQAEIVSYINDAFNRLYNFFKFNEGNNAWGYFKQFLIDGTLAFEIVYSEDAKNIIGFKEIDSASIRPGIKKNDDGAIQKIWVQNEDIIAMKREISDEQIIYLSYAKENITNRISYVERLIRSFNLLRILENSRIIWNIMNSSYRLKMVVPIGTKSPAKAKESLAELISMYKEDIKLDYESGEVSVDGTPDLPFYKNYMFPAKQGESVDIDTIGGQGPQLTETQTLEYFYNKLKEDSKIPFERFDRSGGGGTFAVGGDGMSREEIRFARFITRIRSIFQEIILKPLTIQIFLKYPELAGDQLFKSAIGLRFNEDNLFEEMKHQEIMEKRVGFVESMLGLMVSETDVDGLPVDVPFFDARFLAEKYLKMTQSDLETNDQYIKIRKKGISPNPEELSKNKPEE